MLRAYFFWLHDLKVHLDLWSGVKLKDFVHGPLHLESNWFYLHKDIASVALHTSHFEDLLLGLCKREGKREEIYSNRSK